MESLKRSAGMAVVPHRAQARDDVLYLLVAARIGLAQLLEIEQLGGQLNRSGI